MTSIKKVLSATTLVAVMFSANITAYADGEVTTADTEPYACTAQSYAVIETSTGALISEYNSDFPQSASHLTKLMTILLTAEEMHKGTFNEQTIATTSPHANSMQGTQIWLAVGEQISVEELLYAVTVGNANDASVVLAELVAGSEEEFVSRMNTRAKELSMNSTAFADCSGISPENISTAKDLAILSAQVAQHSELTKYFTTWMLNIRGGQTELVNTNRLVRSFNGITGLKTSSSQVSGDCVAVSARRGEMTLAGVFLNCKDADSRFEDAKSVMNAEFASYEIFKPEILAEHLEDIAVKGGEKLKVAVSYSSSATVVIPRGESKNVIVSCERAENVLAPFNKGETVGVLTFSLNNEILATIDIVTAEDCKAVSFGFSFKRLMLSLLNF